ncbi:MAG TPA: hypothetical protein VF088_00425 [Pyrinomonadaceae bacterium]
MAYNEDRRLYQAAVLTQAEGHQLNIRITVRGDDDTLIPFNKQKWDTSHRVVKARAPFWLYVDSGQKIQENDFSAELYAPNAKDNAQSFAHIFNFEEKYKRPIFPKPETFAEFNFPQGIVYSADTTEAALQKIRPNHPISEATVERNICVSDLAAIDIDAASNDAGKKSIVLANNRGQDEFFRFDLEPGKHYDIRILNEPIEGHPEEHPGDPDHHFRQFYELFDLRPGEEQYLVGLMTMAVQAALPTSPNSPPCVGTGGDTKGGLGSGTG